MRNATCHHQDAAQSFELAALIGLFDEQPIPSQLAGDAADDAVQRLEGERAIDVMVNDNSVRVISILDRLDADAYL